MGVSIATTSSDNGIIGVPQSSSVDLVEAQIVALQMAVAAQVSLVDAPAAHDSTGTAGEMAIGNDGGSPPLPAFFVCLVTEVVSPPVAALWLRIASDGTTSSIF